MIDGAFVIDAVTHGYHFTPDNSNDPETTSVLVDQLYGLTTNFVPSEWLLDKESWSSAADPDLVASALFAESATDVAIYHHLPIFGLLKDGGSPLWVGEQMRERWPGRVLLYGGVSPWQEGVLDEIDRLVEEHGVKGLKLYPLDIVEGEVKTLSMADPDTTFPVFERAQKLGIRSVAVHKALPLGPVPLAPFEVTDVEEAAAAFPDLFFEIVHGGLAFLEETAWLVARFPNVAVNLEGTSYSVLKAPALFAQVIGTFLNFGAGDRIIWATGAMAVHPRPFVEALWNFQMPPELSLGFGLPELSTEIKRGILGENIARILGLDIEAIKREIEGDEFAQRQELAQPWSRATAATTR
jgi:predicted TIM-barrel fold metal-dependent hydrolase